MNSKSIIELNAKFKTVKLLEDSTGEELDDLWHDDFLDTTPKAGIHRRQNC